jgi:hypothetical protein
MMKIQDEQLSDEYNPIIVKLTDLVAILSEEYIETEPLFNFNSRVITDAYNIITGNNPIYTPREQTGGSQVGGEGEEEDNKFNNSPDERLNNVILFFENIRTWKDDQAHIRGRRGQILHNRKLNSIIYDFVETYQVVDHQSRQITDRADQMFLFFAVALLVSIHYIDIKEEYSNKMIDDNDDNLVYNAERHLNSNTDNTWIWMLVYNADHTILTYNNPSNSSPAGFVQAICDESMIFSDAKQQLIKDVIKIANRNDNDKPLNDWLVDRLSWVVKEIARAVLVHNKKLDDLIEPIYDTYKPYHDNDNKNLIKKDLLFSKVVSKVLDLTHSHEYYQIAYLDSLTILSRPERPPPPPPPSGGGGRRTRKHRTKRRTRSEKKGPRRTRKKKNKKQRMSRKRNKSTKT